MATFITPNTKINMVIRLGGIPIILYEYDEQITNSLNSNNETVYAIGMIVKNIITPINPSLNNEISFVWNGIRYAASQDLDGKLYFTANQIGTTIPIDFTVLEGIPVGVGSNRQIMFHNSEILENDIEEYTNLVLGGVPLSVGRVGNNYYIIVYAIS